MSLNSRLKAIDLRRELLELQAKTGGVEAKIRACHAAEDTARQDDFTLMIRLHRIKEEYLRAEIELLEFENLEVYRHNELMMEGQNRKGIILKSIVRDWRKGFNSLTAFWTNSEAWVIREALWCWPTRTMRSTITRWTQR